MQHSRQSLPVGLFFPIAAAIVITPFTLFMEGVPAMPDPKDWAAVWAVALFPGFVGHTLVIWSHRHVEYTWRSALITQCTPVISALLAWWVLGEAVPPLVAVGGAIVIASTGAVIAAAARRDSAAELAQAAEPAS